MCGICPSAAAAAYMQRPPHMCSGFITILEKFKEAMRELRQIRELM